MHLLRLSAGHDFGFVRTVIPIKDRLGMFTKQFCFKLSAKNCLKKNLFKDKQMKKRKYEDISKAQFAIRTFARNITRAGYNGEGGK